MIELPWPPKELRANTRKDRRYSTSVRAKYRSDCMYLALGKCPEYTDTIPLNIIFHPPSKRHMDLDNCLSSIKYGLDGVADAWGVNDKIFRPITIDFGEPVKHGKVIIERKDNV